MLKVVFQVTQQTVKVHIGLLIIIHYTLVRYVTNKQLSEKSDENQQTCGQISQPTTPDEKEELKFSWMG